MAHRHKRRPCPRRQGRRRRRTPAPFRCGLIEAIGALLPGPFFSRWRSAASKWSAQRVFRVAILMAWGAEQTLQSRFAAARETARSLFPQWTLGKSFTGWYEAQAKWLTPLRPALGKRLRRQLLALAGRHWKREAWCAFAADGSCVECPRTAANETELKCAGKERTTPQLFVTTLLHMGTGVPGDFRIGPGTASERRHLEEMLADLPPRSLLVADAGFTGYEFYRRIAATRQSFLLRVGSNVRLLRELGYFEREGRDRVYLWPERDANEPPVVLRLIERCDGHKKMVLVRNVLDDKELTAKSAAVLYEMRWGVEVFYRSLKQTLEKRRMLSRTPEAAKCELTWAMLGLWLLGLMTASAVAARGGDPLAWSAAKARDGVRRSIRRALRRGRRDRSLAGDLSGAVKEAYVRRGVKKARDWPHKKKEKPPGEPKIQSATAGQRRAAKRVRAKQAAP